MKKPTVEVQSMEIVKRELPAFWGEFSKTEATQLPALREAKKCNDSAFNRVWKYLYEPKKNVELSAFEEELRLRWHNAWQLLTGQILNDRKAVLAHIVWCKENFMMICERTAYDDIRRSKMLFGDPRQSTAIFEKARISAILLDQISGLKTISENGSTKFKIESAKAINGLTRRYNAVNGLEDDFKTQLPRPAITINFVADPEVLKKQAAELMEGVTFDTDYTDA